MAKRGLRIKEIAQERGFTLISIARALRMHRSNLSAIASGSRGASLGVLRKLSRLLDCSVDELIDVDAYPPVFKNKKLQILLDAREKDNAGGLDKTWVNRLMLAQNLHYKLAQKFKR